MRSRIANECRASPTRGQAIAHRNRRANAWRAIGVRHEAVVEELSAFPVRRQASDPTGHADSCCAKVLSRAGDHRACVEIGREQTPIANTWPPQDRGLIAAGPLRRRIWTTLAGAEDQGSCWATSLGKAGRTPSAQ